MPASTRQFILVPKAGLRATAGPALSTFLGMPQPQAAGRAISTALSFAGGREVKFIDSVHEDAPKLVEMDVATAAAINASQAPVRALPVVEYDRPNPRPRPISSGTAPLAAPALSTFICTGAGGMAVSGADVRAFTNFALRHGDQGKTDAAGRVQLRLVGPIVERLYIYPPHGYWGAFRAEIPVQAATTVALVPANLATPDCVRRYYGQTRFTAQTGVTVGVVDTGVGPHGDLNLVSGRNTVTGEAANMFQDGDEHGTHVSGLIGSTGVPPAGLRGMAPGVKLRAYRVFGQGAAGATNYAILKAMILAAEDGCDIINLSLGGGPLDDIVSESIVDARNQGMLVVVAAGNDGRRPVNYPAAYPGAVAVSAMGREGTFPQGSLEEAEVSRPPVSVVDSLEFIAEFSNIGPQIAVTGLGVGTLSTLPGNRFGPMSGTSMAAPVVAGAAACLLSRTAGVFQMPRNRARSDATLQLLQTNCTPRQFGMQYEGFGMPDPSRI